MNFKPTNRHILIKPIEQKTKQNQSPIVLPEEYKKPESPYVLCEVLDIAEDSKFYSSSKAPDDKQKFVVERSMIHKLEVEGNEFYLVLENYVFGRIL